MLFGGTVQVPETVAFAFSNRVGLGWFVSVTLLIRALLVSRAAAPVYFISLISGRPQRHGGVLVSIWRTT